MFKSNREKIDSFIDESSLKLQNRRDKFFAKVLNIENKFADSNGKNTSAIIALAAICFGIMWYIAYQTPLAADDFDYHYIYGNKEVMVAGIGDIIDSMKNHYHTMNGRVFIHFIVQLMMWLGKPVFNVCNAIVYVLLTLIMYKHCKGRGKGKNDFWLFLGINIGIWLLCAVWGQTTIWVSGSINYMWGSMFRLAALLPFRLYADNGKKFSKNIIFTIVITAYCFFAGGTNENTSVAMIGMMMLFIIFYRVKKYKIPAWSITGLVSSIGGFLFMSLAPANSIRAEMWAQGGSTFIQRLVNFPANSILTLAPVAALICILAVILFHCGKKKRNYCFSNAIIYVLGIFAGIYSMLAVPYFPQRAWFGVVMLSIIAAGTLFYQIKIAPIVVRRVAVISLAFGCVLCSMQLAKTVEDVFSVKSQYNDRLKTIEVEKEKGNYDVVLTKIVSNNEHSPLFGVSDINVFTQNWSNVSKARYYGLNSITAEKNYEEETS